MYLVLRTSPDGCCHVHSTLLPGLHHNTIAGCARRYDLGKGEWSNPDGCGQGEGEVHLRCTYTPFEMMGRHPADSVTVGPPSSCRPAAITQCSELPMLRRSRH
jgi:hypothetical protein